MQKVEDKVRKVRNKKSKVARRQNKKEKKVEQKVGANLGKLAVVLLCLIPKAL